MDSKKKLKISIKELVLYCISGAFVLWGLVYIILGLCVTYLPLNSETPLVVADNTIRNLFGLGYLGWGLILASAFAIVASIIMVSFAKGTDKDFEKNQKRAARLARNKPVAATEAQVVDAVVSEPQEEAAPVEAPKEEVEPGEKPAE